VDETGMMTVCLRAAPRAPVREAACLQREGKRLHQLALSRARCQISLARRSYLPLHLSHKALFGSMEFLQSSRSLPLVETLQLNSGTVFEELPVMPMTN